MNEGERLRRHIASEATHAIVATLSVRLDAQLAAWQRAIQTESKRAGKSQKVKPRSAADVLWDLQAVVNDLDLRIDVLRREVTIESEQARNAEHGAMTALGDNREDLAKQALQHQDRHARAAASMASEAAELEAVRDAYRRAIAAVQASLDR